jgi:hypothetical protein
MCAIRLWSGSSPKTTPQFRASVRKVAREQGHQPATLDKAERPLIKRGLLKRGGKMHPHLALTEKGDKVSKRACKAVSLAPWKNDEFGRAKRRRR